MDRNIDTTKEIYGAFARGDVAATLENLSPDVEWEHDWADPLPWYVARHGRDAVPEFFAMIARDFEFLTFAPEAFLSGGDMVCVLVRIELRVRATGRTVRDLEAHLWTFGPDGRVSRFRHLVDTHQFAGAAGL